MSTEIKKLSELSDAELDSVSAGQWEIEIEAEIEASNELEQENELTNLFSPTAVSGFGNNVQNQVNAAAQSATGALVFAL